MTIDMSTQHRSVSVNLQQPNLILDPSPVSLPASGISTARSVSSSNETPAAAETASSTTPETVTPSFPDHLDRKLSSEHQEIWRQVEARITSQYDPKTAQTIIGLVRSHAGLQARATQLDEAMFQRLLMCAAMVELRAGQHPAEKLDLRQFTDSQVLEFFKLSDVALLNKAFGRIGSDAMRSRAKATAIENFTGFTEEFTHLNRLPGHKIGDEEILKIKDLYTRIGGLYQELERVQKSLAKTNPDASALLGCVALDLSGMEYALKGKLVEQQLGAAWKEAMLPGSSEAIALDAKIDIGVLSALATNLELRIGLKVKVNDEGKIEVIRHQAVKGKLDLGSPELTLNAWTRTAAGKRLAPAHNLLQKTVQWLGSALSYSRENKLTFNTREEFIQHYALLATTILSAAELRKLPREHRIPAALQKAQGITPIRTAQAIQENLNVYKTQMTQVMQRAHWLESWQEVDTASNARPSPMSSRVNDLKASQQDLALLLAARSQGSKAKTSKPTSRIDAWMAQPSLIPMANPKIFNIMLSGATLHPELKKFGLVDQTLELRGDAALSWLQVTNDRIRVFKSALAARGSSVTPPSEQELKEALNNLGRQTEQGWKKAQNAREGMAIVREQLQGAMVSNQVAAKWIEQLIVAGNGVSPFKLNMFREGPAPLNSVFSASVPQPKNRAETYGAARLELENIAEALDIDDVDAFSQSNDHPKARLMQAMMANHVKLASLWLDSFGRDEAPDAAFAAKQGEMRGFYAELSGLPSELRAQATELPLIKRGTVKSLVDKLELAPSHGKWQLDPIIRYSMNTDFERDGERLELYLNNQQTSTLRKAINKDTADKTTDAATQLNAAVNAWLGKQQLIPSELAINSEELDQAALLDSNHSERELVLRFIKVGQTFVLQEAQRLTDTDHHSLKFAKVELPLVTLESSISHEQQRVGSSRWGEKTLTGAQLGFNSTRFESDVDASWQRLMTSHSTELQALLRNVASSPLSTEAKPIEPKPIEIELMAMAVTLGGKMSLIDDLRLAARAWVAVADQKKPAQGAWDAARQVLTHLFSALYPLEQQRLYQGFKPEMK